jgi:uncharacterized membrane protein YqiK
MKQNDLKEVFISMGMNPDHAERKARNTIRNEAETKARKKAEEIAKRKVEIARKKAEAEAAGWSRAKIDAIGQDEE